MNLQSSLRFPLFISLENKLVVLVGGGNISLRRVQTLLLFGCRIQIIAPTVLPELEQLAKQRRILWKQRRYQDGDLAEAFLAIAATDDRTVNHAVGQEANARGILVSVSDCSDECSFYFPAIATDGQLVAGIVGDGSHHKKVRQTAEEIRRLFR